MKKDKVDIVFEIAQVILGIALIIFINMINAEKHLKFVILA